MYKLPMIFGILSALCILLSISIYFNTYQKQSPILFSEDASSSGEFASAHITVDIEGAVESPGVYEIETGSRIEDVIVKAGGLSKEADDEKIAASINRAAKVLDGAKIYIPKIGDSSSVHTIRTVSDGINVNTASQSELESLPGIGPTTAEKIISGRPYQTLDELVSKKILYQSTYGKIKDRISL